MEKEAVRRCIFHIPNYIEENAGSASGIRPWKMLEAFRSIGYEVDVIMGYGKSRKEAIKKIKQNIRDGVRYEFLYSESSTMPTLMTESHHLPTYPLLDFSFFRFCKRHGIRIGLFYRDIYWKFDSYKDSQSIWKRIPAIWAYRYDLKQYKKYLSKFYLPSDKMYEYLSESGMEDIQDTLPPGSEYDEDRINDRRRHLETQRNTNGINIFYVGGVGNQYRTELMFKVVSEMPDIQLTVCCSEKEWSDNKQNYMDYLTDNILIIHKRGRELEPYFKKADICSLFFEPDVYRAFAMPFKTFEYLSNGIPSIASKGTAVGELVEQSGIGWTIEYDEGCLRNLLKEILEDKNLLACKTECCLKEIGKHTWEERARKVEEDLIYETEIQT